MRSEYVGGQNHQNLSKLILTKFQKIGFKILAMEGTTLLTKVISIQYMVQSTDIELAGKDDVLLGGPWYVVIWGQSNTSF